MPGGARTLPGDVVPEQPAARRVVPDGRRQPRAHGARRARPVRRQGRRHHRSADLAHLSGQRQCHRGAGSRRPTSTSSPNGKIVTSWANKIVLLDPDTGLILKIEYAARRDNAAGRCELQAPDRRARRHPDPQGSDPADRLHGTREHGHHQGRPGGIQAGEFADRRG